MMNFHFNLSAVRTFAVGLTLVFAILAAFPAFSGELHAVARRGDLDALAALLKTGVDVNETDGEGETALHKAAKAGHTNMVSTLLAAGANPLVRGTGPAGSTGTPLHQAAKFGHVDVVRILIEAGIDPNLTDADVGTPLHLAVRYRRNAVAHFLKSQGASPIRAQTIGSLIASADLEAGRKIANTCRTCHDLDAKPSSEPRQGPTLWGIVGRPKAAIGGFAYSEAMIATGGVWSYDALNSFIADPKGFLPGTKMIALRGIEAPDRRAALIRFLRDLSDAPIELPN